MKTTYINSFYRPWHVNNPYINKTITVDSEPAFYAGYNIYKASKIEYHIVKDGICVGMMGSIEACQNRIDNNKFETHATQN